MIKAFVGDIGSGKTFWLSQSAQWFFSREYKIYSNMPLWGYNKKKQKVTSTFYFPNEFQKLVDNSIRNKIKTLFIIDEATLIFSKYDWNSTTKQTLAFISQSRKLNIHIFYTSQRYADVIVPLRENSNIVIQCKRYFPRLKRFSVFTALAIDKTFYTDKAQSGLISSYIKGRKINFQFQIAKKFDRFISSFIVLSEDLYRTYADIMPKIEEITPEYIISESKKYVDDIPPLL